VNPVLHMKEPIRMDGQAFTAGGLLDHCRKKLEDPGLAPWFRELLEFIVLFMDASARPIVQRSSGSTGDPKTFSLSREAMVLSAQRTLQYFDLKKGERVLLALPVHYIAGKMMVVRALVGGLDLLPVEPSSRPLKGVKGSIAFAAMVPLQIEESLNHGDPLERISKLLIGGGELHPATREAISSMAGAEVYESFGMTETYTHFAMKRINGPDPQSAFELLKGVRAGLDPRGCLEVDIPGITSGKLLTNDLVEINPRGDGFTWLGRFDNVINTGGIKIIPELLEAQIGELIGHECLVLPEADRKLGKRLVLLVEFGGDPPVEMWLDLLRSSLSNYELPRRILAIQALPRNRSMKPDRTSAMELLL